MPSIINLNYRRPGWLLSNHLETIFPALFRKVKGLPAPESRRIDTPDGDFLDLFWLKNKSNKVVIIQHGLEGSADRSYIRGMSRAFYRSGYNVLTWNFRGCSTEMNKTKIYYHSGATYDLAHVIDSVKSEYSQLYLVGFSLGGNMTLKYLGEQPDARIKAAVAISVPLDLSAGADNLHSSRGYIYEKRFLRNLKKKIKVKARTMPKEMDLSKLDDTKSIRDFDENFTAPLHGFQNAADYYQKCSSKFYLKHIQIPTLILNALNDPFLTPESLDMTLCEKLDAVLLEISNHGGHVGFTQMNINGIYWSEKRALEFCEQF